METERQVSLYSEKKKKPFRRFSPNTPLKKKRIVFAVLSDEMGCYLSKRNSLISVGYSKMCPCVNRFQIPTAALG